MQKAEIVAKIGEVLGDFFRLENVVCTENTSAADIEGWNSFSHLPLLAKMEDAFSVKFSFVEITGFSNVGDIADCILKKISGK
ncbi:MAG: acyl carrier protein [Flavobacteriales bacterium]